MFIRAHSACPLVGVLLCELSFELHRAAQSSFEVHRGRNAENSGQLGNSMGGDEARKELIYILAQMCSCANGQI